MSDTTATPEQTPAPTPDVAPSAAPAAPATPWAPGTYDEARAASLIEGLKGDKAKLAERLAAFEAAEQKRAEEQMSEVERAQAALARAEAALAARDKEMEDMRAAKTRSDILARHGLKEEDAPAHLKYVPADELEAAVADVVKLRGPARENAAEAIPGKPAPKLTPGHQTADAAGTPNIRQMAADILNRR